METDKAVGAITQVLVQFVLRLSFGLAAAMGMTSSRLVTSGFFRVHLWVIMGLNTFAALAVFSGREQLNTQLSSWQWQFGLAVGIAVASYMAAVVWLYEVKSLGVASLFAIAAAALITAFANSRFSGTAAAQSLTGLNIISGGMLLGTTMAAMLLGHWYLNTPSMQLAPLRRLILAMGIAVAVRAAFAAAGLVAHISWGGETNVTFWLFISFRWLAGILGPLLMARMAWMTLKIPNTQSATGILYAGVILVFLGELVSQLLSADALYPV